MAESFATGLFRGYLAAQQQKEREQARLAAEAMERQQLQLRKDALDFDKTQTAFRNKLDSDRLELDERQQTERESQFTSNLLLDREKFAYEQEKDKTDREAKAQLEAERNKARASAAREKDRNKGFLSWIQAGGDPYAFDAVWNATQAVDAETALPNVMGQPTPEGFDINSLLGAVPGMGGQPQAQAGGFQMPPGWQLKNQLMEAQALSRQAYAQRMQIMTPADLALRKANAALAGAKAKSTLAAEERAAQKHPLDMARLRAGIANTQAHIEKTKLDTRRAQQLFDLTENAKKLASEFGGYVTPGGKIELPTQAKDRLNTEAGKADAAYKEALTAQRVTQQRLAQSQLSLKQYSNLLSKAALGQGVVKVGQQEMAVEELQEYVKTMTEDVQQLSTIYAEQKAAAEQAKELVGHYTREREKYGLLKPKKPVQMPSQVPAVSGTPRAGARGVMPVTPPPGARRRPGTRPNTYTEPKRTLKPKPTGGKKDYSQMSDAELKAALARKLMGQ